MSPNRHLSLDRWTLFRTSTNYASQAPVTMHPKLAQFIERVLPKIDQMPTERKEQLETIAGFVKSKAASNEPATLMFICTHNSRRSHLAEIWAATAAAHYGIAGVETYSGGTESSAFNPRAVAALQRAGFAIEKQSEADNPHYLVSFAPGGPKMDHFSKKVDDASNPHEGFVAVMTCSQADQSCPFVKGAALRVALPYEDPKVADGTPGEAAKYDERTEQIATEMFYVFSKVSAPKTTART